MSITRERWNDAQDGELPLHRYDDVYSHGHKIISEYLEFDYEIDFYDKTIVEVGGGPMAAALLCKGNTKRSVVVEPLVNRMPAEVLERYTANNIEVVTDPYEETDLGMVDETWFFNALPHFISVEDALRKAKETSKVIRVFESLYTPINNEHPHSLTPETFTSTLGNFGKIYKGGSRAGFHEVDCYYGTWYSKK